MPSLPSPYCPPFLLRNGHFNTIGSHLFRKVPKLPFQRRLLPTPDGDFLHIEELKVANSFTCVILVHGLEGSAHSSYISTLAHTFYTQNWNVAALHLRGCSGTPNALYRAYHSGSTDDLQTAIAYLAETYHALSVVGFSLGGNIVLKYMGEKNVSPLVKAAVGISVPCHLSDACNVLATPRNTVYHRRFMASLKRKLKQKMALFPGKVSPSEFRKIKTIRQFDESYTAPSNGYASAEDYYTQCSSLFGLSRIHVPTLLINAQDDPFLSPSCFPTNIAETNPHFYLRMPTFGGHVGYWPEHPNARWKHEDWTLDFLKNYLKR